MKRKIGELILIIFFYLLQVTLGRVIAIGGIKPNLLIILPVLFGFLHGKNEGMYVGIFAGFFYDLFFSGLFGFTSLVFAFRVIGHVHRQNLRLFLVRQSHLQENRKRQLDAQYHL